MLCGEEIQGFTMAQEHRRVGGAGMDWIHPLSIREEEWGFKITELFALCYGTAGSFLFRQRSPFPNLDLPSFALQAGPCNIYI